MTEELQAARLLAEKYRDHFCRLAARSSKEYDNLKAKHKLPWE